MVRLSFSRSLLEEFIKISTVSRAITTGFSVWRRNFSNRMAVSEFLLVSPINRIVSAQSSPALKSSQASFEKPPEELLGALLFLIDENYSSFVNGVIVPVDGGFSAYSGV